MDEYLLKARLDDIVRLSHSETKYLGFLDQAESIYLKSLVKNRKDIDYYFWGGFDEAERLMLAVGYCCDICEEFPIVPITLKFRSSDSLSHRDILGSMMSQGVNRNSIGDILVEEGRAVVFVKNDLAQYFLQSITKIGKVGVKCSKELNYPLPVAHNYLDLNGVVASERLDCIIGFLMKTSRDKACSIITAGIVNVNYNVSTNRTLKIKQGDIISIRGTGKFLIDTVGPLTKKERLLIKCKKYI